MIFMNMIKKSSIFFIFLVLSSFSLLIPPFEGYDENAHYSRILDSSRDIRTQFRGEGKLNQIVVGFPGPIAYSSGVPPYSGEKTYDGFFAKSDQDRLLSIKQYPKSLHDHNSSEERNWQYQHPPLFYLTSSFIGTFFKFNSLLDSVYFYRFVSVFFVLLGLFFVRNGLAELSQAGLISLESIQKALWLLGLCFPMFYFEFARIGNDSLTFLFLSLVFLCTAKLVGMKNIRKNLFLLAISLMLCLWTKALVIPMIPIFAIYSGYFLKLEYKNIYSKEFFLNYIFIFVLPVFLGSLWYIYSYLTLGHWGIGIEASDLQAAGGLLVGLNSNFDLYNFARGILVPFATFTYAGSWSLIIPSIFLYIALGAIYLRLVMLYLVGLNLKFCKNISIQPIILLFVMYVGMVHHVLVSMALNGLGTTPGWYLYVLTAWLVFAIALASKLARNFEWFAMSAIGFVSLIYAYITSALIYSGYITKSDQKSMSFLMDRVDFFKLPIIERLSYIAYPEVSMVFMVAAMLLVVINLLRRA